MLFGASAAGQHPVFATDGLGVAIVQDGLALPIADFGAHYLLRLRPGPFSIRAEPALSSAGLSLALGITYGIFERHGSAETPLFGPASAYAREPKAGTLYLTDPACLGRAGSGFNILWPEQLQGDAWPIERILPDRASESCAAPSLPTGVSLIAPGQTLMLVASDGTGDGADFLVLVFGDGPAS
ncbi:MAG: hypothetical protein AAGA70_16920 [Pseudomonadota bacterium]